MNAIEVHNLYKKYDELTAVDNFSFTVGAGELLALVGPDGAGKTSIFRSLCDLIDFDSGDITIGGYAHKSDFNRIKDILGYMPQQFSLYPDLSVEENLVFYAGLFGFNRKEFDQKKEALYKFSGLGPFARRRASALSGGMKQKLALSCNLVHDPKILLLDEPTTGVDPLSRRQFWDILKNLRADGASIMVSTPYMDEVALADRAIFIYQGRKLIEGTPRELTGHFDGNVYRADFFPSAQCMEQLEQIDGLSSRRFGSTIHLYTAAASPIDNYLEQLHAVGIERSMLENIEPDLEDVFIQQIGK
ncbi:MAG: ABC transporter ATP-binding protein [Candidatus Zixiibacteriota bacterium]